MCLCPGMEVDGIANRFWEPVMRNAAAPLSPIASRIVLPDSSAACEDVLCFTLLGMAMDAVRTLNIYLKN
jgi:hypothetical protein